MGQLSTYAGALVTAASLQQAMTRQCVYSQTCQAMAGVRLHVRRSVAHTEDGWHCGLRMNSRLIFAHVVCESPLFDMTMQLVEQVHGHDFNAIAALPSRDAYAAASEEKVGKPDSLPGPSTSV